MATAINLRHGREVLKDPDVVRIDRATKWGNRYVIGRDGDRAGVIARYREWLWRAIQNGEIELAALAALQPKRLACWCRPEDPCHGDVLARAADWAASVQRAADQAPDPDERLSIPGDDLIGRVSFRPISPDEARIYDHDGDCIGEVYRQPDILNPGGHFFVIHLAEDPRGWTRVHDRARIREIAERRVLSHPLYG